MSIAIRFYSRFSAFYQFGTNAVDLYELMNVNSNVYFIERISDLAGSIQTVLNIRINYEFDFGSFRQDSNT